jgi:hypothetical protein
MAEARVERRLAAILAADVAGYSRLMGIDEEATRAALKGCRPVGSDELCHALIQRAHLRLEIGWIGFPHPCIPDIALGKLPKLKNGLV